MKSYIPHIVIITFLSIAILFIGGQKALAELSLDLEYAPPCLLQNTLGDCTDPTNSFAAYIKRIYQFGLGISGVLAVGMIVAGAIRRVVSAGNPGGIDEANKMITSALWGVALLFGSYLILRTINPQLVSLREPALINVSSTPFAYQSPTSTYACPIINEGGDSTRACFFDPENNIPLDFQDSSKTGRAIDAVAAGCNGSRDMPVPGCKCDDCKPLSSAVPVAGGLCRGGGLGVCFLESRTVENFSRLVVGQRSIFGAQNGWRIGEAWPPNYEHQSACHYNGTCFDLGKVEYASLRRDQLMQNPTREKCEEIRDLARYARGSFDPVYIEAKLINTADGREVSQLDWCIRENILLPNNGDRVNDRDEVRSFKNTGGIHLHIGGPK